MKLFVVVVVLFATLFAMLAAVDLAVCTHGVNIACCKQPNGEIMNGLSACACDRAGGSLITDTASC